MYPVKTLLEKERFLKQANDENWFIYLEHDAEKEIITITFDGKKASVKSSLTLNDL